MAYIHCPRPIDISSSKPKAAPSTLAAVGKAVPLPANHEPVVHDAPPLLKTPKAKEVVTKNEKASSSGTSNATYKSASNRGANNDSSRKTPELTSKEVVINASNKAICDLVATRAQSAATETVSKAIKKAESPFTVIVSSLRRHA